MRPYYEADGVTIYHGDCREILPSLDPVDLVLTDPPYGINHPTDYARRGRGRAARCTDYPPVHGDDQPFDPAPFMVGRAHILWGANYYANQLPPVSGWLVWDKERPDDLDQATCELAWTDCVKGARRFRFLWNGAFRHPSEKTPLQHPTQKPLALMQWCLTLKWVPAGIVLDPFMGSGTTLVAARNVGRPAIGVEISERYCEIAAERLSQTVLNLAGSQPETACLSRQQALI